MHTRVIVNIRDGIIEAEGDEAFVSLQIETLKPLLQLFRENAEGADNVSGEIAGAAHAVVSDAPRKRKKRSAANPPKGTSCRARILELKDEGFFRKQHSPAEIVAGLKARGLSYVLNQVGAALSQMHGRGEIQRTGEAGDFRYFWGS